MRHLLSLAYLALLAPAAWAQANAGVPFEDFVNWPDLASVEPSYGTIALTVVVSGSQTDSYGDVTTMNVSITRMEKLSGVQTSVAMYTLTGTVGFTIQDTDNTVSPPKPCQHNITFTLSAHDFEQHYDGALQMITSMQLGLARFSIANLEHDSFEFSSAESGCNAAAPASGKVYDGAGGGTSTEPANATTNLYLGHVVSLLQNTGLEHIRVPYYSNQNTAFATAAQAAEAAGQEPDGTIGGNFTESGWDGNQTDGSYSAALMNGNTLPVYALQQNAPNPPWPGTLSVSWTLSGTPFPLAAPDDDEPDTSCHATGSDIICQGQTLGESIPISGTPFFLRYSSDRSMARTAANPVAITDAQALGGWTLSPHHVMDPNFQNWCPGGSCTPGTEVPKAFFLGNGSMRAAANVQSPVPYEGSLALASEDGKEIYVFSQTGTHVSTLRPMTGAPLYGFGYDTAGNLVTVSDAYGNVTTIQRDSNENPTAIVAPYGQTTQLSVDGSGYLNSITDPDGSMIQFTNQGNGLISSMTDGNGNTYNFLFDAKGRLVQDSDPAGGSFSATRIDQSPNYSIGTMSGMGVSNAYSLTFTSTPGTSNTQKTISTFADGTTATETVVQSANQIKTTSTAADGSTYADTAGSDPRWGIQVPVYATQNVTMGALTMTTTNKRTISPADAGDLFNIATQTDTSAVNGRTYTSTFTSKSLTYANVSPVGRKLTVILDKFERTASSQIGAQTATAYTYDPHGRLSGITQGARASTLGYDANGNLASLKNADGAMTFTYDAAGYPLSMTWPDGRLLTYTNDANGNRLSITTPRGQTHQFSYTPVNLLASYTPPNVPGTGATNYSYNLDRQITSIARPDGANINYSYDSAGRIWSRATPTETINYNYDGSTGHLISEVIPGGEELDWTYTGAFKTSETWKGQVAGSVARSFDKNFWVASETLNGGTPLAFTYDNDGLITGEGAMSITRNAAAGLITASKLGVVSDSWTYDSFGEPATYTVQASGATIYSAAWTFDNLSRISALKETVGKTTNSYAYTYDTSDRLSTVVENANALASYTYDNNSNWQSVTTASGTSTATVDAQDRLLTYGSLTFTYGANGELASQVSGPQTTNYTYDALGNLIAATLPDGTALGYVVDGQNRRVGVTVNGILTAGYLWDGSRLVGQLDGNNNLVSQFVWGTRHNIPDYMISNGVTYRFVADATGSPRLIVNTNTGAIAEQIDYSPFGDITNDTNPGFQPFGFAGGLYDQKTKLLRFGARDYYPAIGRWTAKDPARFAAGDPNLYAYALNNPLNRIDVSGLDCTWQDLEDKASKWLHDKGSKVEVGPATVDLQKGTATVGTSATVEIAGQNVVSATAEVGVQVGGDGAGASTLGSLFVNLGVTFPTLAKIPVIGQIFSESHGATVSVGLDDDVLESPYKKAKSICFKAGADGEVGESGSCDASQ